MDLFGKADFLHRLFDTIPSFLFIVDSDVRIFHLNNAALKLLGGDRNRLLLKRGGEALHCIHSFEVPEGCGNAPHCRDCVVRNSVDRAFRGEAVRRQLTRMTLVSGGVTAEVHLSVTADRMDYEGQPFVLLIMEDVTGLKRVEEELRRRTRELEAINEELDAFGYSVAHDLRAPLRAITGFTEALVEDHAASLDATAGDYLERISNAGRRMSQMIDDLLKLSRLCGEMVREKVDLSRLAEDVAGQLAALEPGRKVEFSVADGMEDWADAPLMRAVFENLLGNSWKFTSRRSPARIEFSKRTDGATTVYFIRDNGVGFDMAYAGKLFDPFQRLHSQEEFPGSGIGLATVRRIIRRHGGAIWAEAAPDRGATFFFTLNENV
ncbi:MAG: ATP-binding protein [Nitrospiraceae bacterium]|nr:ATP-binding protein [Nitrospiraceae bacterium]